MTKEVKTIQKVIGCNWLGQFIIHNVPSRNLTQQEYEDHKQTILNYELASGSPIYERLYEVIKIKEDDKE